MLFLLVGGFAFGLALAFAAEVFAAAEVLVLGLAAVLALLFAADLALGFDGARLVVERDGRRAGTISSSSSSSPIAESIRAISGSSASEMTEASGMGAGGGAERASYPPPAGSVCNLIRLS